jgi:hypothetical protein
MYEYGHEYGIGTIYRAYAKSTRTRYAFAHTVKTVHAFTL